MEQQPPCSNGPDDTQYKWSDDDPFTGLSFPLYKYQRDWAVHCSRDDDKCRAPCEQGGGFYDEDKNGCFAFMALKKVCVKIDMNYYDNLLPEDAEIVSGV